MRGLLTSHRGGGVVKSVRFVIFRDTKSNLISIDLIISAHLDPGRSNLTININKDYWTGIVRCAHGRTSGSDSLANNLGGRRCLVDGRVYEIFERYSPMIRELKFRMAHIAEGYAPRCRKEERGRFLKKFPPFAGIGLAALI